MPEIFRWLILLALIGLLLAGSIRKGKFMPDKFFIALLLVFMLPGLIATFVNGIRDLFVNYNIYYGLLIGLGIGLPFAFIIKRFVGFSTFEHEATHAFVTMLFFRKITAFVVTKSEGGYVQHRGRTGGKFGDHMITLAPYFLPLFVFVFALMRPLLGPAFFPWWDIWIGIWFTFYLFTYFSEIKSQWTKEGFKYAGTDTSATTDIAKEGYIFSFLFILFMTLFFYGLILNIIYDGYGGLFSQFGEIFRQNKWFYGWIF